jgi:enoyl-CoA hydratase/carnithine racemase
MVARVNGPCLAGGIGLMLSCDIVIARNDTFFCTPEVNVGIFPMMIAAMMYRDLSWKKATEMALTGRRILALEAENIGLITRAVEPSRLDQEVQELLKLLTSKSSVGLRIGKQAVRAIRDMCFDEAVDYLRDSLFALLSTADAREGIVAFMEKREPKFKGR